MTSGPPDIVKRLRHPDPESWRRDRSDAADEIEKLRREVEKLTRMNYLLDSAGRRAAAELAALRAAAAEALDRIAGLRQAAPELVKAAEGDKADADD